ncbi:MAG: hypothetical protein ACOC32_01500 [Nanoarchaeota archaeon]
MVFPRKPRDLAMEAKVERSKRKQTVFIISFIAVLIILAVSFLTYVNSQPEEFENSSIELPLPDDGGLDAAESMKQVPDENGQQRSDQVLRG